MVKVNQKKGKVERKNCRASGAQPRAKNESAAAKPPATRTRRIRRPIEKPINVVKKYVGSQMGKSKIFFICCFFFIFVMLEICYLFESYTE